MVVYELNVVEIRLSNYLTFSKTQVFHKITNIKNVASYFKKALSYHELIIVGTRMLLNFRNSL